MKLKTNLLTTLGFSTICAPGLVLAAAPLAFDGWTTDAGGNITTGPNACPAINPTCSTNTANNKTLASDAGFLQQEVQVDGYSYIRLIVTDPTGAGGPSTKGFSSEMYVPFATAAGGFSQGVAAKQVVRDAAQGFTDQAEVQTGMMRFKVPGITNLATQPSSPTPATEMFTVRLSQAFDKPDYKSTFDFTDYTAFSVGGLTPDTDNVIGHTMAMTQTIPITNAPNPNAKQTFIHREAGGYAGNALPPVFPGNYLISAPITTAGSLTIGGTPISWTTGQTVSTSFMTADTSGSFTSSQTVSNLSTGTQGSITDPARLNGSPFVWDPVFGPTP